MNGNFRVPSHDQIDRLIAFASTNAPHRVPAYRAVRSGIINLVEPSRDAAIPKTFLNNRSRPMLLILGDDDLQSTGPSDWVCAKRAKHWAAGGIIHAAGGDPEHYSLAIMGACIYQRLLLVETDSEHRDSWTAFLRPKIPLITIKTPEDVRHPRPIARESMQ